MSSNAFEKHLVKATASAKAHWGAGWANLTDEMRSAFVCKYLVGTLAGMDFQDAFGDQVSTELEQKLLGRLNDLTAIFGTTQE